MPKKEIERFYMKALQRALLDAPSGSCSEPEPPDFLFVKGEHRVGIELTAFYLPPKAGQQRYQECQSLKEQIVYQAERLHAQAGGPGLYVDVIFNEREQLRTRDIRPFARELADVLLAHPGPERFDEPAITIPWRRRTKWIAGIRVYGSVDGVDRLWEADAGGWAAKVTSEHILEVLRNKARSVRLARSRCDELWLVIVNDDFSLAPQAEISMEALHASYEGSFERLIWLLPHVPRAFQLRLAQPVEGG